MAQLTPFDGPVLMLVENLSSLGPADVPASTSAFSSCASDGSLTDHRARNVTANS